MGATVLFQGSAELATLTNTFSVGGTPTDPTAISLEITTPAGTATTYTYALAQITRTSAGLYTKDISCTEAGTWQYVWTGTGTASDVVSGTWEVLETGLGHLYCTVDSLKSRLSMTATDTIDDFELHQACFSASRWLEQYCQRAFYRTSTGTARTFIAKSYYCLDTPPFCDIVSVSALATDDAGDGTFETSWSASDYQLLPFNPGAAPETRPYTEIRAIAGRTFPLPWDNARADRVQVTGVFGWPAVPMAIKQAALLLAAETFKLKDAPFGVAGMGEWGLVRIRENPKLVAFAGPYRKFAVLVG